jgi:hypothetical protein
MDKRITRYTSLQAMKADEYRLWQRLPGSERLRAVMDSTLIGLVAHLSQQSLQVSLE